MKKALLDRVIAWTLSHPCASPMELVAFIKSEQLQVLSDLDQLVRSKDYVGELAWVNSWAQLQMFLKEK